MNTPRVRLEVPRKGKEFEFFLQKNPPRTVSCSAHIHNAVELLFVKRGRYSVRLNGIECEIEEGDLILFDSYAIHHVATKDEPTNEYYVIKSSLAPFLSLSENGMGAEYALRFVLNKKDRQFLWKKNELEGSAILPILQALICEYETAPYASDVAIALKVTELLLAILREDTHTEKSASGDVAVMIYRIMAYVQDHYTEELHERALARELGISYSYFSRSFKAVTGMPFKKYLNLTRIRKAEQLLYTSNVSVTEAAAKCGYNSTSYFINVYRTVTGTTPYRTLRQRKNGTVCETQ